ncbi:Heterokaryon incompatibility protein 6, OR allele, partial [Madurella mycetomatis]
MWYMLDPQMEGTYLVQISYYGPERSFDSCFFLLEPINDANKHSTPLTCHTRSCESLSLAKQWVTNCSQHHEKCKSSSVDGIWYPTRLLDLTRVNHTEPSADQTVCLIETAKKVPAGRYSTLSHRWGSAEHTKLTKNTYFQYSKGVPLESLPQLIKDSIFVSLELGVLYLWIDLLCICQDDVSDWQREASLMQKVYSNGFCNISASDANGCFESMFNCRNPDEILPQIIELKTSDQRSDANRTKLFRILNDSFWDINVSKALVNTRAWVFQERFLAPRVLQFGKRLLTWDCLEGPAAEIFPDGLPDLLLRSSSDSFKNFGPSGVPMEYSHLKPYVHWGHLVRAYTACALTFQSDKLIAFSGVAKYMAEILKDEYVAGMWRRYLEGELLWHVEKGTPGGTPSQPVEYRAPSWSWASIHGRVRPGRASIENSLIKVEEVHLEYQTGDKTGGLTGGWLRLRGVLKELRLVRNTSARRNRINIGWDMFLEGVKVTIPEEELGSKPPLFILLDVDQEEFNEENANDLLFAMIARKLDKSPPPNQALGRIAMFILLFRLMDREKAVFKRIGIASTWNQDVEETILKVQRPANASP